MRTHRLMSPFIGIALVLLIVSIPLAQPVNDQEFALNATLSSDTLTIACSAFLLPIDVGRILDEPAPISSEGEFSATLRSAHPIKATLQPESGTADNLATISGCSTDGVDLFIKTNDAGDTITITETGNIVVPGADTTFLLDDPDKVVHLVRSGANFYFIGSVAAGGVAHGDGANCPAGQFPLGVDASGAVQSCTVDQGAGSVTLDQAFDVGKVIDGANSQANAAIIGDGSDGFRFYVDATDGPTIECFIGGGGCPTQIAIATDQTFSVYDVEGAADMFVIDPDAASRNLMYQFTTGYEPLLTTEVVLRPANDNAGQNCSVAEEAIVAGDGFKDWITCADTTGDAVSFDYKLTAKIATDTTHMITLYAVNKNAAFTGSFALQCAAQVIRPGIDTFTSHDTTGQQTATFPTMSTQSRLEKIAVTMTLNGTVAADGIVKGQCVVSSAPTEIADIRLSGTAMVEVFANSLSD